MKNDYDLHIITYYTYEDEDNLEENFSIDYSFIEIRDNSGKLLVWYGDSYHDKGEEKVEGFLDAFKVYIKREPKIKIEKKMTETMGSCGY